MSLLGCAATLGGGTRMAVEGGQGFQQGERLRAAL